MPALLQRGIAVLSNKDGDLCGVLTARVLDHVAVLMITCSDQNGEVDGEAAVPIVVARVCNTTAYGFGSVIRIAAGTWRLRRAVVEADSFTVVSAVLPMPSSPDLSAAGFSSIAPLPVTGTAVYVSAVHFIKGRSFFFLELESCVPVVFVDLPAVQCHPLIQPGVRYHLPAVVPRRLAGRVILLASGSHCLAVASNMRFSGQSASSLPASLYRVPAPTVLHPGIASLRGVTLDYQGCVTACQPGIRLDDQFHLLLAHVPPSAAVLALRPGVVVRLLRAHPIFLHGRLVALGACSGTTLQVVSFPPSASPESACLSLSKRIPGPRLPAVAFPCAVWYADLEASVRGVLCASSQHETVPVARAIADLLAPGWRQRVRRNVYNEILDHPVSCQLSMLPSASVSLPALRILSLADVLRDAAPVPRPVPLPADVLLLARWQLPPAGSATPVLVDSSASVPVVVTRGHVYAWAPRFLGRLVLVRAGSVLVEADAGYRASLVLDAATDVWLVPDADASASQTASSPTLPSHPSVLAGAVLVQHVGPGARITVRSVHDGHRAVVSLAACNPQWRALVLPGVLLLHLQHTDPAWLPVPIALADTDGTVVFPAPAAALPPPLRCKVVALAAEPLRRILTVLQDIEREAVPAAPIAAVHRSLVVLSSATCHSQHEREIVLRCADAQTGHHITLVAKHAIDQPDSWLPPGATCQGARLCIQHARVRVSAQCRRYALILESSVASYVAVDAVLSLQAVQLQAAARLATAAPATIRQLTLQRSEPDGAGSKDDAAVCLRGAVAQVYQLMIEWRCYACGHALFESECPVGCPIAEAGSPIWHAEAVVRLDDGTGTARVVIPDVAASSAAAGTDVTPLRRWLCFSESQWRDLERRAMQQPLLYEFGGDTHSQRILAEALRTMRLYRPLELVCIQTQPADTGGGTSCRALDSRTLRFATGLGVLISMHERPLLRALHITAKASSSDALALVSPAAAVAASVPAALNIDPVSRLLQQGPPIEQWGLDPCFFAFQPIPICLLWSMPRHPVYDEIRVLPSGRPILFAAVTGVLLAVKDQGKSLSLLLDDGTGVVVCIMWRTYDDQDEDGLIAEARAVLRPGNLVQVRGRLTHWFDEPAIRVDKLYRCSPDDPSFETAFMLAALIALSPQ